MRPAPLIDTCRSSHRQLLDSLERSTDDDVRQPSRLPGYTRGHLITHLTYKARAHVALFEGAAAGETRRLHPVGYDADAAATAGAARAAAVLHADLTASFALLEAAWDGLDDGLWDRPAIMMAGPRPLSEVVGHHLRNVEVHHVDLDIGYQVGDWPDAFVEAELTKRLAALADRADHAELLAWLLDRAPAPDLGPW